MSLQLERDRIAFLCPGQGSQSIGMLDAFIDKPKVRIKIEEASQLLGRDLLSISRDKSLINDTVNTQPLMFLSSVASAAAWFCAGGCMPDFIAGHSLGEYSALAISGVLKYQDALCLVDLRARAMRDSAKIQGSMSAIIGLDEDSVESVCRRVSTKQDPVSVANFNSEGQVVIAGSKRGVELAQEQLRIEGAKKCLLLAVSVPSHCVLMQDAAEQMQLALEEIEFFPAQIPVIQNVQAKVFDSADQIKKALVEQLTKPVQWTKTIRFLAEEKRIFKHFECGWGKVLTGLGKRINKSVRTYPLSNKDDINDALAQIKL